MVLAYGCGEGSASGRDGARSRRGGEAQDSADGVVVIGRSRYAVKALPAMGAVQGTVQVEGAVPADSTYEVPEALRACGAQIVVPAARLSGGGLEEAVVWLETVTAGKPLPELRRAEVAHEQCRIVPRVQAVVAGTTLNIGNDDPVPHNARFGRFGSARALLKIPFTAHGQVVPSETLAREAGIVQTWSPELPWARAYVAVFDHPYFAVTAEGGRFAIDSVPPGRYTLKVWHPRAPEVLETPVEVAAGAPASAALKLPLR